MCPREPTLRPADVLTRGAQVGVLFVHKCITLHKMWQCARWHGALLLPNRDETTHVDAVGETWVGRHGPMKESR